jgi:hypothetical protein
MFPLLSGTGGQDLSQFVTGLIVNSHTPQHLMFATLFVFLCYVSTIGRGLRTS